MLEESYLTLSQLNRTIRTLIEEWLCDDYWVVAEVAEISPPRRGHTYLQLVEKTDDAVVAQARATLWATRAPLLAEFEAVTGETLKPGMEVLMRVRVRFHEVYGLSLDVMGLNPIYTLGGMARKKRETLDRLAAEGLLDRNRRLPFPLVPQRVAIISSPTAAGLGDFVLHLNANPGGYVFSHALFTAAVQGSEAEESLAAALREVRERADLFDVAVILRGGGSQVDLSCFDAYRVTAEIARCPMPVVTGIGHEKDESVADITAHTRVKTPTAAAELLIERVRDFEARLLEAGAQVADGARARLDRRRVALERATRRLTMDVSRQVSAHRLRLDGASRRVADRTQARLAGHGAALTALATCLRLQPALALAREEGRLDGLRREIPLRARSALERADATLEGAARDLRHLDPVNVLRRGYSITRCAGRVVRDTGGLAPGDVLQTQVLHGMITSRIETTEAGGGEPADTLQQSHGATGADRRAD